MCVEIIKVASEVLNFSRQRTLVNMRFLEPAIRMLTESPSKCMCNRSYGMGTDGKNLYYNPEYVLRAYQKEKGFVSRMYLHLVVHGIFRHFFVNPQIEQRKWDLACDMATEYIIESWKLDLSEIDWLEKIFRRDDHSFWYPETKNRNDVIQVKSGQVNQNREVMFLNQKLEELWKQAAKKIQVDLETFMKSRSGETGDFLVNLKLANRKKQDYSAFLRKFTRLGERMKINDEEFDYNFYTYGMQLYGNMPLIEPLEYKDVRVVKTFVTVIDTSGSVEEEKLRRFLEKTYQILKSGQKSEDRVNFHLIQCDALVQKDVKITSEKELEQVMEDLTLYGRGGTDFRPAFEYIEELRKNGELTNLNGMLYFTDGMGVYPRKKPEYPVAFIYDSEVLDKIPEVPAWAIRYLMDDI